jgi:fructosamine-3-kinase
MSKVLTEALEHELGAKVASTRVVSGGDINQALCATLADGTKVFVKSQPLAPKDFFACEADGLAWLAASRALRIPRVLAATDMVGGKPAFLALEWIEPGPPARDHDEQLGRGLAALHRSGASNYGYVRDNFLATLEQANGPHDSWPEFYATKRIMPLAIQARMRGLIDVATMREVEGVCERMATLCGPTEPPSRLHGDLWGGNAIVASDGAPVLIDPAVYGGHREVDLAMMRLFGGFGPRVFAAYEEAHPLAPGSEQRVPLYQLYPLLAHVCLFGTSYTSAVKRALAAFA